MIYIILSLVALGVIAAILGYFRNKKLERMLERGEISEIPEPKEIPEECCGQHETCERDSLLAAVSKQIEYYDDEELDRFKGVEPDAYEDADVEGGESLFSQLFTAIGSGGSGTITSEAYTDDKDYKEI